MVDPVSSMERSKKIVCFVGSSMIHFRFPHPFSSVLKFLQVFSGWYSGGNHIPKISSMHLL
jgi:hypothetical protein